MTDKKHDLVVTPKHYARWKIEPINFLMTNGVDAFQFNIIKYVMRHEHKNGIEDLQKARRYLDMYIMFLQGDPDWWKNPADKVVKQGDHTP